jgi:Flp pilus assembly protein TadD
MEVRDKIKESENLIRKGRYTEAIELLTALLADDPEDLAALLNVGIAYTENGENDKAIRALTYYQQWDSENAEALEALGCAFLRKREYEDAERHLNRAREIAPNNASILRNLSVLLSRTDRSGESFTLLKHAHELDPKDYLTTYALGSAYKAVGATDKAIPLFESLLNLKGLPDPIQEEAQKQYMYLTIGW